MQNSHFFPGKLEILSFTQYTESSHRYCFFDQPQKNRLYVRIPKDKKYTLLEEFAKQMVLSQLTELNFLFLRLNTESVKIKLVSTIQQSLVGIHSGLDEYIESMGATDHDCVEIRFPLPTQLPFVNECKYVYYDKWKPFVDRRMEENRCFDEYFFKYEKPSFLNEECLRELRTCGIAILHNDHDAEFELHFEIFYYPNEMICV
jgi:hypothetical protein